jgi:hypothetical protein
MFTIRFRLRSLMILVALAGVGSWIAITSWRIWSALSVLQSAGVLSLAYAVMVVGVITSVSLIVFGVVLFAHRIRGVSRATSHRSGPIRTHLRDNQGPVA